MNKSMETETRRAPGRPKKRQTKGRQYERVTVLLPPKLVEALDTEAEAEGLESRSELVRQACTDHLRRLGKRRTRDSELSA